MKKKMKINVKILKNQKLTLIQIILKFKIIKKLKKMKKMMKMKKKNKKLSKLKKRNKLNIKITCKKKIKIFNYHLNVKNKDLTI